MTTRAKLPEKIEAAIRADLPPAFWERITLLRAAIREALAEAEDWGYCRGQGEERNAAMNARKAQVQR